MSGSLTLSHNGRSAYRIVIARDATDAERFAASELQEFLHQIGTCRLPIVTDEQPFGACDILLGPGNRHLAIQGLAEDTDHLGAESFVIRTEGCCLAIASGRPRGTVYGVYTFLEQYLGCRFLTAQVSHIPKRATIEIPPIALSQGPAFEYREPYSRDAFNGAWCARNKMNSNKSDLDDTRGGRMRWYNFHHSFYQMIHEKDYFADHPEYFSLVGGQRLRHRSQLCLTNPDVVRICTDKVRQWIRDNPACRVFSVGQNDWGNSCTCDSCRAVDEREGSQAGTMLQFVNQIAAEVEPEHPDVLIHTFAYQYTRKAPRTIRPRANVIVRLCTIECCFSHPLERCSHDRHNPDDAGDADNLFLRDLREWSQITDRLYIWDYITNFSHYLQPFPNLRVLEANIRLFHRYGVKGVLEQGNFSFGGGGEMNELRAYVLAKLLWDPAYGAERAMDEFLTGYFGMAAQPIRAWLTLFHDAATAYHAHINDPPSADYWNDSLLDRGDQCFDEAERLADNDERLERVRKARLALRYVRLCRMDPADPARALTADRLADDLKKHGITEIWERKPLDISLEMVKNGEMDRRREIPRWDYYM
jgi:hypothetical protein